MHIDARRSLSPDAVVISVERAVSVNREPLKVVAVPNDVTNVPSTSSHQWYSFISPHMDLGMPGTSSLPRM